MPAGTRPPVTRPGVRRSGAEWAIEASKASRGARTGPSVGAMVAGTAAPARAQSTPDAV